MTEADKQATTGIEREMSTRYMLVWGPNRKYQVRVMGPDCVLDTVLSIRENLIPELLGRPLSLDISQPHRHRKRGDSVHLYLKINGRGVDSHLFIGADSPRCIPSMCIILSWNDHLAFFWVMR